MSPRFLLLAALLSILSLAWNGARAQPIDAERKAPPFEYYTVIDSLNPVTGLIRAAGVSYHLHAETRIWIDDRPATRAELSADMIGLRIGLDAYEHQGRRVITMIHVMKSEGRGAGGEREAQ